MDYRSRIAALQADMYKWERFANERTGLRRKQADAEAKRIRRQINTLRNLAGI